MIACDGVRVDRGVVGTTRKYRCRMPRKKGTLVESEKNRRIQLY
jgi:hypothetical protein